MTLFVLAMINTEKNRASISPTKLESAHALFFYRDDCPKCRQHFLTYYLKSLFDDHYVLINTNNASNAKLAQHYHVEKVPTIIVK